jgi:hypothetical protein
LLISPFKSTNPSKWVSGSDRWSQTTPLLDEAGEVLLEQKLPTTPEAMKQAQKDTGGVSGHSFQLDGHEPQRIWQEPA